MFRKAVSTLEGVKAGKCQVGGNDQDIDGHRRRLQLSATFQPRCCHLHVAYELHLESSMVSFHFPSKR